MHLLLLTCMANVLSTTELVRELAVEAFVFCSNLPDRDIIPWMHVHTFLESAFDRHTGGQVPFLSKKQVWHHLWVCLDT